MREAREELPKYFNKSIGNALRFEWRRRGRECQLECPEYVCSIDPDAMAIRDVRSMFCKLDDNEQELLTMHLDGYSHEEVAVKLGVSAASVRKRYSRIIAKLRELFAD